MADNPEQRTGNLERAEHYIYLAAGLLVAALVEWDIAAETPANPLDNTFR